MNFSSIASLKMYKFLSTLVYLVVTELIPSVSYLGFLDLSPLLEPPDKLAGSTESESSEGAFDLV
jgi:hypothetical protein